MKKTINPNMLNKMKGAGMGAAGLIGLLGLMALHDQGKQVEGIESRHMPNDYNTMQRLGWEAGNIGYEDDQAKYSPGY